MMADEQDVMTWYDLQTEQGDQPTVNWSDVEGGLITRIRATFDPRPIVEGRPAPVAPCLSTGRAGPGH